MIQLKSGLQILAQAHDIEVSLMLFDKSLLKGNSVFSTYEESLKQPAYRPSFIKDVPFQNLEPNKKPVIRDYLKEGLVEK